MHFGQAFSAPVEEGLAPSDASQAGWSAAISAAIKGRGHQLPYEREISG
jgi:hypothetical protein